jgi:DNA-binding transcriptional LysR family regulator
MPGIVVTPVVMILEETFPGLRVNVLRTEWDSQVEVLRDGRADVSLVRLPVTPRGLTVIPLYTEPKVVVLPVDHPLSAVPDLRIADLVEYELLQQPDAVPEWRDAAALLRPGEDRPRSPVTHSVEEKLEQVAARRGIAILPKSTASYYVRPDVISRRIVDALPSEVAVVFETDHRTSHVEAFITAATELIPRPAEIR